MASARNGDGTAVGRRSGVVDGAAVGPAVALVEAAGAGVAVDHSEPGVLVAGGDGLLTVSQQGCGDAGAAGGAGDVDLLDLVAADGHETDDLRVVGGHRRVRDLAGNPSAEVAERAVRRDGVGHVPEVAVPPPVVPDRGEVVAVPTWVGNPTDRRYGVRVSVTAGVEVAASARAVFDGTPDVVVAYLFGSRAAGRPRVDSDVDLAVLLSNDDQDALLRVAADLSRALAPLAVDLVDLRTAPDALAYRVLRAGTLLISRDEGVRRSHWVRVVDRYLDMAPARRLLAEGTRRRLREGRFGRS